jgi:hypothetical protein
MTVMPGRLFTAESAEDAEKGKNFFRFAVKGRRLGTLFLQRSIPGF